MKAAWQDLQKGSADDDARQDEWHCDDACRESLRWKFEVCRAKCDRQGDEQGDGGARECLPSREPNDIAN